jgi:hypothetical protein
MEGTFFLGGWFDHVETHQASHWDRGGGLRSSSAESNSPWSGLALDLTLPWLLRDRRETRSLEEEKGQRMAEIIGIVSTFAGSPPFADGIGTYSKFSNRWCDSDTRPISTHRSTACAPEHSQTQ